MAYNNCLHKHALVLFLLTLYVKKLMMVALLFRGINTVSVSSTTLPFH